MEEGGLQKHMWEKACGNMDGKVANSHLGSIEISHVGQGLKRDGTAERQIWARLWVFINGGGCRPHSDRGKEPFKVTGKEDGNLSMRDP